MKTVCLSCFARGIMSVKFRPSHKEVCWKRVPGYCYLGKIYILPYSKNIIVIFVIGGRNEKVEGRDTWESLV